MKAVKILLILLFINLHILPIKAQQATPPPALSDSNSYTWILLPDLQSYQKFGRNQSLFTLMVDWIKDQKTNLNIQMVLCVGDLVEQNDITEPDGINGDQTGKEQWTSVSKAFGKLDGVLPYILCTGNHDIGFKNAENRQSHFDSYFPPKKNPLNYSMVIEMAPDAEGKKTLENACYEWKSPTGQLFLLFSLEVAPRKVILEWAKEVASRPQFKNHLGVVLTHIYLNSTNERITTARYPLKDANYGETIWQEIIQPSEIIRFVFSGHVANSDAHKDQVGYREDKNIANKTVHQMMFNAQREGGGWHGNGGDGWLRILEFLPDQKSVVVHTFSPFFYISPSTRHLSWRTEDYDHFKINY
jgi:hypothetical protein